ncbi:hypothetical protein V3C85_19265 [Tabrizicola sp. L79]|uniref:hypothetical protein n=1 Tax=Pseudotabrizicola sp. L79 TaxID=3118402 RepID=UPI002F93BBF6
MRTAFGTLDAVDLSRIDNPFEGGATAAGTAAADAFSAALARAYVAPPDLGLGAMADDARAWADAYREAAGMLARPDLLFASYRSLHCPASNRRWRKNRVAGHLRQERHAPDGRSTIPCCNAAIRASQLQKCVKLAIRILCCHKGANMAFFRYLAETWSFGVRVAALSARIEEGTLTPAEQAKAVREILVPQASQSSFKKAVHGLVAV